MILVLIASRAAFQTPFFKFSDPLSANPGSAPASIPLAFRSSQLGVARIIITCDISKHQDLNGDQPIVVGCCSLYSTFVSKSSDLNYLTFS